MWVGPVMERRSWAVIDWPIVVDEIEALIADPATELDPDWLARHIGADQRGLGAVEYILLADEPEAVLAALDDPRRCAYLTGITTVISDEAELLAADWAVSWDEGAPYRDTFADADGPGLDSIVNDALFLLEAITDAELGRALGVMDAPADPEAIDEGPAGLGVADLERHLAGLRAVFVGTESAPGLSPLLGGELTERLTERFAAAEQTVGAVDGPLITAVNSSASDVAAVRDAIKEIQVTVATEVVGRLGVTIGFSDADGDSSS
jgi:predicted lipoprotein